MRPSLTEYWTLFGGGFHAALECAAGACEASPKKFRIKTKLSAVHILDVYGVFGFFIDKGNGTHGSIGGGVAFIGELPWEFEFYYARELSVGGVTGENTNVCPTGNIGKCFKVQSATFISGGGVGDPLLGRFCRKRPVLRRITEDKL